MNQSMKKYFIIFVGPTLAAFFIAFIIPFVFLLINLRTVKENIPSVVCLCFYLFHYFYRYVYSFLVH